MATNTYYSPFFPPIEAEGQKGSTIAAVPSAVVQDMQGDLQAIQDNMETILASPVFDDTAPAQVTNLVLTTASTIDSNGTAVSVLIATWNKTADTDIGRYDIQIKENTGNYVLFTVGADLENSTTQSYQWSLRPNQTFTVQVRAVDKTGNVGPWSAAKVLVSAKDTVPPAAPTNLTVTASLGSIFLRWTCPADTDLASILVYESATNSSAAATLFATVNAQPSTAGQYTRTGLSAGNTRWFFLKAVDFSGNLSVFSAGIQGTIPSLSETDFTPTATGISPVLIVTTLPTSGNYEGRTAIYQGKLYRYTSSAWTAAVAATDLTGTITSAQITDAAISATKFASGIEPVTTVTVVPATKSTATVFNTTDSKLYRWNGTVYVSSTAATDITGTITNTQIAGLDATKLSGQLADAQLAAIAASKITGTLVDSQIAAVAATKVTGTLTNAQIASIDAAKLTSKITTTQIADNSITTALISAGAVVSASITSGAVTADKISANTITGDKLAVNTITASRIFIGEQSNYVLDPKWSDLDYWTIPTGVTVVSSGTDVATTLGAVVGLQSETGNGTTSQATKETVLKSAQYMPVEPGLSYRIALDILVKAGYTGQTRLGYRWYNRAGTLIGTTSFVSAPTYTIVAAVADTVINSDVIVTAPSNAAYASLLINNTWSSTLANAQYSVVARPTMQKAAGSELIVDGSIVTDKLAANAITATKLAANSVTANAILAGTITSAEIAAGAIIAAKIAANAITTEKMVIASGNLIPNGDFGTGDLTNWRPWNIPSAISVVADGTNGAPAGSGSAYVCRYLSTTSSNPGVAMFTHVAAYNTAAAFQDGVAVSPGEKYRLALKLSPTTATTGTIAITAYFRTPTTTVLTNVIPTTSLATYTPDAWNALIGEITVPANALRMYIYVYANTLNGTLFFTNLNCARKASGELIVDGAITSDSLATNAVTAGKLAANAVTAGTIAANAISAREIAAGAITISSSGALGGAGTGSVTLPGLGFTGDPTATNGDNLIANSSLLTSTANWQTSNVTRILGTTTDPGNYFRVSNTADGAVLSDAQPIPAGATSLFISYWKRSNLANKQVAFDTRFYDSAGVIIGSLYRVNTSIGAADTWAFTKFSIPVPINAITFTIRPVITNSVGTANYHDLSSIRVASTELAATVGAPAGTLVGATAATTVESYANDPAARVNANTTTISGGKITTGSLTALQIAANTITSAKIAANTITSAEIAAGTITAAEIATDTITAAKIAAGAIGASEVAAGAITASKVGIRGENLWPDQFCTDVDWWKGPTQGLLAEPGRTNPTNPSNLATVGWQIIPNAPAATGALVGGSPGVWQLTSVSGFTGTGTQDLLPPSLYAKPSNTYEFSLGCYNNSNRAVAILVQYFTSTGASISSFSGLTIAAGDVATTARRFKFTTPANANSLRIEIYVAGAAFSGTINLGNFTLREAASGTMIVDGSITAAHIVAGSITSDRIQAGTIAGDRISTSTSLPGTITVGNTGVSIATVQSTAASAAADATAALGAITNITSDNILSKAEKSEVIQEMAIITGEQVHLTEQATAAGISSTALDTARTNLVNYLNGLSPAWNSTTTDTVIVGSAFRNYFADYYNNRINTLKLITNKTYGLANDPAGSINARATTIDPGKILISGGTTLASWRNGTDATKIDGGNIAANTITANKLRIGSRGINAIGIDFRVEGNTIFWTTGYLQYMDNQGNTGNQIISAGSYNRPGGNGWSYIYWELGSNAFAGTTDYNLANIGNGNMVAIASWYGGNNVSVNYGGTVIDGDRIVAGTVRTGNLAAQAITAEKIAASNVITSSAQIGNAVIQSANIGTLQVKSANIENLTVGSDKIGFFATQRVWWVTRNDNINVPATTNTGGVFDTTTILSTTIDKYGGSESVLQFDVQCPLYGADAVKVNIYMDIWQGGTQIQNRVIRMEVDGNNETYLPFLYQHLFLNVAPGTYEARFSLQHTSGHACRLDGLTHMIVREFVR